MPTDELTGWARPARILVVDDERHITRLIEFMLKREGYEIYVAHDGAHALVAAAEFMPDALLLDMVMPGLSGADVLRHLRADRRYDQLVVIVLTGHSFDEAPNGLAEAGASFYCVKPIAPSSLIRKLLDCGIHPLIEERQVAS